MKYVNEKSLETSMKTQTSFLFRMSRARNVRTTRKAQNKSFHYSEPVKMRRLAVDNVDEIFSNELFFSKILKMFTRDKLLLDMLVLTFIKLVFALLSVKRESF